MLGIETYGQELNLIVALTIGLRINFPLDRKVKHTFEFKPSVRTKILRGEGDPIKIRVVVNLNHDPILGYGIGKVKPLFWGKFYLYNVGFFGAILAKVEVYHCEL